MIDTITFCLHNVSQEVIDLSPGTIGAKRYASDFNRTLYNKLCAYEGSYIEHTKEVLVDELIINPESKLFKSEHVQKIGLVKRPRVIKEDVNQIQTFFRPLRGNMRTPSHEYRTKFYVSDNYDVITFELSIPKYFYNHNIAQFVPNFESKRVYADYWGCTSWRGQVKMIRQRIIEFIYTFFQDLSLILDLPSIMNFNMHHIEIKRLDLCYNQLFPDVDWVLDFLDKIQKVKKSRIRKNTIVTESYEHSFSYRHSIDGFYFKVYAKGFEFLRNDYARLWKENEKFIEDNKEGLFPRLKKVFMQYFPVAYKKARGGVEDMMFEYYKTYAKSREQRAFCHDFETYFPYKLAFLTDEAMKILRYEMSFTRTYLSTLYKREVFRKKCPHWKKMKQSHDRIKQRDLYYSQGNRSKAEAYSRRFMLGALDQIYHDAFDRSMHKKHNFFIQPEKKLLRHEESFTDYANLIASKRYKIIERDDAFLSDDLFKIIYEKFTDEIEFYQIKDLQETHSILTAIDEYNKEAKKRCEYYIKTHGEAAFKKLTHTYKRKHKYAQLRKTRLKLLIDEMEKGKTMLEICEKMGMSKSSYYALQKDLAVFNVFKNTIKHKYNYSLLRTDWKSYYDKFSFNRRYAHQLFYDVNLIHFDTIRQNR